MSARKLQQEFDKTNKKIAEGLSVFDDIYEKLMTTEISSQKEKLESDLKKEIKKLQRSRDQLKTWLNDSSIKLDKDLLLENRTKIEHAMDQFKDLEKSSKIKQFSNEGLELQSQRSKLNKFTDPEDAKKQEACTYISDIIEQLNQQNESLESEIHQYTVQLKKTKSSNAHTVQSLIEDARYKVERNNTHLTKLEKILRSLENENLDPERIEDIKDDLEYYVENNQEDDYVEYDEFYDQLEIDDDNLDVQGSLTQLPPPPEKTDVESKPESTIEKTEPKTEPKTESKTESKPEPAKTDVKTSASTSTIPSNHNTPTKKVKHTVAPALNPPPITNEKSFSNVIKAAQAASAPASAPTTSNSTLTSTPVKVPPPGLDQAGKSNTVSPEVVIQNTSQIEEQKPQHPIPQESQSPGISNENKTFFDTISRLSTIPQSRLQNPLPFQSISNLLESSLLNCPDSFDAEKPRQYNPINIHPSSIDYPQEPMYELNSSHIMKKFDNDTLFFCFYYSEGIDNLAKWNASKELSRRGWIFNTESKQWFLKDNKNGGKNRSLSIIQKEEEQDKQETTGDIEKEQNYKYFDYEKTWLTRRKEIYKFSKELRETF